jgi:hypothetical protein
MVASVNKIYTSQKRSKFSLVFSLVGSSRAIFINNILYYAIAHRAKDNIDIQGVFIFFKIMAPFVSISFVSFVNSECLLRLLEK